MSKPKFIVERVPEYYERLSVDLGALMPALSTHRTPEPLPETAIRPSIESPQHELIIARSEDDARIVGAATLSQIYSMELKKPEYWLGGFVVDPAIRNQGLGSRIFNEAVRVCAENDSNMGWTSNHNRTDRADAIRFYESKGAKVRQTTVYHLEIE